MSHDAYAAIADSDLVSLLEETADYLGALPQPFPNPAVQAGLPVARQLAISMRYHSPDGLELAKKVFMLFFTAVALYNEMAASSGGDASRTMYPAPNSIALSFFKLAVEHAEEYALPIDFNASSTSYLLELSQKLRETGWLETEC